MATRTLLGVVALVLVLVIAIGTYRLGGLVLLVVSDDRSGRDAAGVAGDGGPGPGRASTGSAGERSASTRWATLGDGAERREERADLLKILHTSRGGDGMPRALDIGVAGKVSPIHVIRSSEIVGGAGADANQLALLDEAVGTVRRALEGEVVVLDADAIGVYHGPAVLYVDDGLDLTPAVQRVYEALGGAPVVTGGATAD